MMKALNIEELAYVVGGKITGCKYTVTGATDGLDFKDDYNIIGSHVIAKLKTGDRLIYIGDSSNGYDLVEDPKTERIGYVKRDFLK